ncbi:holo-[acyl-carrier protein] synthase [Leucobacter exalbidus]|uniref:Holo-[acyl-carrier-protein] synthase n=1 Tax=Leucobacter exalbidus TaxID=662960 RepID=A0A940T6T8_9MICO|nr:holo-ACP synthase [Leucobacter exalbidus]MBP1327331.1 holo-[acyl-carrier protein] synthase [Leucobacter exalbidus]
MIIGIGVDTVDLGRFERQLARTPALAARLFTAPERELSIASLGARFAAKEALIKALGGSDGISWQDLEVLRGEARVPCFTRTAALERALQARGGDHVHVSLTHDGGIATAFVVVEARMSAAQPAMPRSEDKARQE